MGKKVLGCKILKLSFKPLLPCKHDSYNEKRKKKAVSREGVSEDEDDYEILVSNSIATEATEPATLANLWKILLSLLKCF